MANAQGHWGAGAPAEGSGHPELILRAIRRAGKPLSVYALKLATGLREVQIRSAIGGMLTGSGGIVSKRGPKGCVYDIYRAPAEKAAATKPTVAGRITVPQFRWGATRLS